MSDYEKELETAKELFEFLQGKLPAGYKIPAGHMPKLNADQAATVLWYLGNLYCEISDNVNRCEVCGELYHSYTEGETNDHRPGPVFACGSCIDGPEVAAQRRIGRKLENHRMRARRQRQANNDSTP